MSLLRYVRRLRMLAATLAAMSIVIGRPALAETAAVAPGAEIDAYLESFVPTGHLTGHVLVARGEETLYERSFGMANYELDVPIDAETRFCVASINKPMTIVIAARLIEAGKLDTSDVVATWIPGIPSGDKMTVDHLLNHRAGIPHRLLDDEDATSYHSPADMAQLATQADLSFEPGTDNSYSSGGYSVLARVLELASGQSFDALLHEHVFEPAGMKSSADAFQRPLMKHRASSYQLSPRGGLLNAPLRDLSYLVGAGSVYSTARDLLTMMRALIDGRYGEAARAALMRDTGMSWNGATHGFRAFIDYDKQTNTFVAFTSNLQTGAADHLRRNIPRILAGERPEPLPEIVVEPAEVPTALLERYEGVYELRPGRTMGVRVEEGALRIEGWLLIPESETEFFSPQDYGRIQVVLDGEGSVERLDWRIGEKVFPMPRVDDLLDDS